MSRYCASCGKLLADDAKFCTSCGAPVEQTTASNGQPAFEQTGFLDTPQAKPDDPLAYRPDPAASPAAVETTQRIPVADTPPQQQPASTYAPDSPQAPAAKKSSTKALIAVIVVLVAIIIALVIFFVIKPFDNAATQTTAEITKLHHDVDSDDLKPLGNLNSLYDDDDDDDDGEATLSEQNLYRRLSEYYDLLEDLDSQVRACAEAFNGGYLEKTVPPVKISPTSPSARKTPSSSTTISSRTWTSPQALRTTARGRTSLLCTTTWITASMRSAMPGRSA